jgi:uncharacterized damage-inducible protein DinB
VSGSLLDDAFAHHLWATLRLIDACLALSPEQLRSAAPGTFGPILETMRHLVSGDSSYLGPLTGEPAPVINEEQLDLPQLRAAMEGHGAAWSRLLARDLDPDAVVVERDDDGYVRHAAVGLRLAQALNHGTDHRSQICTALTVLGVEPPDIDVWEFGLREGRIVESAPWLTP